jgi:cell division protein FtsB
MTKARLEQSTKQSGARSNGTAEIAHARARIQKLKAEVARLEQENRDLLERFQRWSYNAASRGMTEQQLDQAIIMPGGSKR